MVVQAAGADLFARASKYLDFNTDALEIFRSRFEIVDGGLEFAEKVSELIKLVLALVISILDFVEYFPDLCVTVLAEILKLKKDLVRHFRYLNCSRIGAHRYASSLSRSSFRRSMGQEVAIGLLNVAFPLFSLSERLQVIHCSLKALSIVLNAVIQTRNRFGDCLVGTGCIALGVLHCLLQIPVDLEFQIMLLLHLDLELLGCFQLGIYASGIVCSSVLGLGA